MKPTVPPRSCHVMVDLETEGTSASARVFAIGMAAFTASGIKERYYIRLNPDMQKGRTADAATMEWWGKQSEEAAFQRTEAYKTGLSQVAACEVIRTVLGDWSRVHGELVMWGNGPDFDISILTSLMQGNVPWKHWNVQSLRTLRLICPQISRPTPDLPHHALEDAIAQARWAVAMHNDLAGKHMVYPFL